MSKEEKLPWHVPPLASFFGTTIALCAQTFSVAKFPHEVTLFITIMIGVIHLGLFFSMYSAFGKWTRDFGNPLLAISFYFIKDEKGRRLLRIEEALILVVTTIAGAFAGTLITFSMLGNVRGLGRPEKGDNVQVYQAFLFELYGTFALVLLVLMIHGKERWTPDPGLAGGFVVGALNMMGIDQSGAAMNPFRYLAPALISWTWHSYDWIYVVGPLSGAVSAHLVYYLFFEYFHQRNIKKKNYKKDV